MKSIGASEILCLSCGRKHTIVSAKGVVTVDCPARYAHDIIMLRAECSLYLPKDAESDCTGECKECETRTEWQEWA